MNPDPISSIVRRAVLECLALSGNDEDRSSPDALFRSPQAVAVMEEIIQVGKKLWHRQYVDGNGGNISFRLTDEYVISTPTLLSKADLTLEDFSLVDMNDRQVCGVRQHTSELLLHLEIYKAVPAARAVVHCHPPYATAHAIAGVLPPANLIPEMEVFVGPVALAPYDTPGTQAFAETIIPFAKNHNTILLTNHGIICWADTITHAEWFVEVVETYCKTAMIAAQLRPAPLPEIPPDKVLDLLARKKKYGLPDARYANEEESLPAPGAMAATQTTLAPIEKPARLARNTEERKAMTEALITRITAEVKQLLQQVDE